MPASLIASSLPRDLTDIVRSLEQIGAEHRKCLACHCYREVAEAAVSSFGLLVGHAELVEGGVTPEAELEVTRLRELLDSSEGSHG